MDVGRHLVGCYGMEVLDSQRLGVVTCQSQGTLVHVDSPDAGIGAVESKAQGDWPPPRADVQQVAVWRRNGRLAQQYSRADVDPVRTEDARCRLDDDLPARQVHPKLLTF